MQMPTTSDGSGTISRMVMIDAWNHIHDPPCWVTDGGQPVVRNGKMTGSQAVRSISVASRNSLEPNQVSIQSIVQVASTNKVSVSAGRRS